MLAFCGVPFQHIDFQKIQNIENLKFQLLKARMYSHGGVSFTHKYDQTMNRSSPVAVAVAERIKVLHRRP